MPDLGEGAVFAGHRIDGVAGRGGMGTVYRATHIALDHMVALKVIAADLADDDSFRERFKSESRIAVSLRHPNVVPIHHAGEEDGLLFVTMDLIDGPDLRKLLISRGPIEPAQAVAILEQVGSALDIAHSRGLVHRDIKPGNILIEERAGSDHAYLTDFGLTKRMDQASEVSALTSTGAFVGTLDYVAPEQIRGEELDARTDVYALGCVLYEMLGAQAPFSDREEKVAKMYAHLQDRPAALEGRLAPFGEVVDRAMAKDREGRFPSAGDLARAATAALAGESPMEAERSVATGPAAPTQAYDALAGDAAVAGPDPGATVEADPPPDPTVESPSAAEPGAEPDPDLQPTVERRTPPEPTPEPSQPPEQPPAEPSAPRTAADREPPPTGAQPVEPGARDGDGSRSRAPLTALLIGVVAAIAVAAVLLAGGDDAPTTSTTTTETGGGPPGEAGEPVAVAGFPVGIATGANQVRAVSRQAAELTEIGGGRARPTSLPPPADGAEEVVFAKGAWWATATEANSVVGVGDDDTPIGSVPVGAAPKGIAAAGADLWVVNSAGNSVTRLTIGDAGAVADPEIKLRDASEPHGIAIDPGGDNLWVSSRGNDSLIRVGLGDPDGDQELIDVGKNPKGVAVTDDAVWVANADGGTVSRYDPLTGLSRSIRVKGTPRDVVEAEGLLWASNGDGYVSAITPGELGGEGGEIVGRVLLDGAAAEDIAFDEESGTLWVTTGGDDTVIPITPG